MKYLTPSLSTGVMLLLATQLSLISLVAFSAEETSSRPSLGISSESEGDPHDKASVLLRYVQMLGGPRAGLESPSLTIFRDGHVRIFYPNYMKQAGTYTVQLDRNDLDQLWQTLTDTPLLEFNPQKIRHQMTQHKQTDDFHSTEVYSVSDAPTITIELYPNRYFDTIDKQGDPNKKKTISWHALTRDAEQYPEIAEIQQLYTISQQLEAIMQRSDLIKIDEAR